MHLQLAISKVGQIQDGHYNWLILASTKMYIALSFTDIELNVIVAESHPQLIFQTQTYHMYSHITSFIRFYNLQDQKGHNSVISQHKMSLS